jgi:5-methylcytosine-specific restriction endonuclease McrA
MSPPKTCITPRCPGLTTRTRCPRCESIYQAERNARPGRQAYKDPIYRSIPRVGECEVCGTTEDITLDHILPLSKGGTNDLDNLRYLCRAHNSSKHNKEMEKE